MTEVSIHPFARAHLDGVIRLVAAEGWAEYADDPERTNRALCAQGVTTLVALAGEQVIGELWTRSAPFAARRSLRSLRGKLRRKRETTDRLDRCCCCRHCGDFYGRGRGKPARGPLRKLRRTGHGSASCSQTRPLRCDSP
jgi:hypothetical protein